MAVRLYARKNSALLADCSSPMHPFEKSVMIFVHKFTAGTDYTAGGALTLEVDGAQNVLYADFKDVLSDEGLGSAVSALTYTEDGLGAGRQGKSLVTANTNASSAYVMFYAIVGV